MAARRPTNLSRLAAEDLFAAVEGTQQERGSEAARRVREQLYLRCIDIAAGRTIGHTRPDLGLDLGILFATELPWPVAFDRESRNVLEIVHGSRDMPTLIRARR